MADAEGNQYGPYDIEIPGSQSESLTEAALHELLGHLTGVKSGGDLTFNGLTATLAAINARVHGTYLIRTDPWSDPSPATSTSAPRRDLLVARRLQTSGEGEAADPGETVLVVLRGTPASNPVNPSHDPISDERLWSWQVPGNAGTVVTGQVDHRRWLLAGPVGVLRRRRMPVTASGTLLNGAIANLVAPVTVSGDRYPAGMPWNTNVKASVTCFFPPGVGARLEAVVGGVTHVMASEGNGGTSRASYTLQGDEDYALSGPVSPEVVVRLVGIGGTTPPDTVEVITTGGEVVIEAQPYEAL